MKQYLFIFHVSSPSSQFWNICITYTTPLYVRLPYILLHDYDYSEYYPNSPQVPHMPLPAISIQSSSMNHIFFKSNCDIYMTIEELDMNYSLNVFINKVNIIKSNESFDNNPYCIFLSFHLYYNKTSAKRVALLSPFPRPI